jgi:hypothetical protein
MERFLLSRIACPNEERPPDTRQGRRDVFMQPEGHAYYMGVMGIPLSSMHLLWTLRQQLEGHPSQTAIVRDPPRAYTLPCEDRTYQLAKQ